MADGTMTRDSNGDWNVSLNLQGDSKNIKITNSDATNPLFFNGNIKINVSISSGSIQEFADNKYYVTSSGFMNIPNNSGNNNDTATRLSDTWYISQSFRSLKFNGNTATLIINTKDKYLPPGKIISCSIISSINRSFDSPWGYMPKEGTQTYMCKASNYETYNINRPIKDYISYGYTFHVLNSYNNDCYVRAKLGSTAYNISAGQSIQVVKTTRSTGGYYTGTPGSGLVWHPGTTRTVYELRVDGSYKDYVEDSSSMNFYAMTNNTSSTDALFIYR